MITKILNQECFLQKNIPIGTSSTSFRWDAQVNVMRPVMETQTGRRIDYIDAFVKVTGTMPAASTVTVAFYKKSVLIATATSGALGAYTNTTFTQRFAVSDIYDSVVITVNCKQTTSVYTVDIICSSREIVLNDHYVDSPISSVSYALGASVAAPGNIDSTITFLDSQSVAVTERVNAVVYTSSDADGETPAAVATTFSATAGSSLQQLTLRQMYLMQSTAAGLLTIRLNHNAGATFYLNVLANNKKWTSGAIVWT